MRRKKSICSTCLNSCHQDDLKDCDRYISFRQLSVQPPKKRDKAISEYTWADYGISMEQYRQLKSELEAGKYQQEARQAAEMTDPLLASYIIRSVRIHNGTFEDVEYTDHGKIPVCRTYFYGYRRRFYKHLIDIIKNCTK